MTKNVLSPSKLQIFLLVGPIYVLVVFFVTTMCLFGLKDTHASYSLLQSWNAYYSVEDWNLTKHAIIDMDGDGQKDMITSTNCAFLSSMSPEKIPSNKKCKEPRMSSIAFPDNSISVGQKLSPTIPVVGNQWLRKSYLVKTNDEVWKFYDISGLQLRTYELKNNNLFIEVMPTILDRIDTFTYQISHIGVTFLLAMLPH